MSTLPHSIACSASNHANFSTRQSRPRGQRLFQQHRPILRRPRRPAGIAQPNHKGYTAFATSGRSHRQRIVRSVSKAARRIAKKAGLTGVSLHTMRHSHGSQLLSLGVPLPTVSKQLGHANVHVTATVYSHALPSEVAAAQIWNEAMSGTLQPAPAEPGRKKARRAVVAIDSAKKSA